MQIVEQALILLSCFLLGIYLPEIVGQVRKITRKMRDNSSEKALCRIIELAERLNAEHSRQCGDYMHAVARDLEHKQRMEALRGQV